MDIKKKINNLPLGPGVYLMKDGRDQVIYIGKANSLRKRVSSYFAKYITSYKTQILVSNIKDIDFIPTKNESESLILESLLVKKYQPKFNIELRDDKSFPYVAVTKERFPRIFIARIKNKPQAIFLGPYTNVKALRLSLKALRHIFGFRSCRVLPKKSCLYWRIKLCPGPCINKINPTSYQRIVKNIILFLEGKHDSLVNDLKKEMFKMSRQNKFEQAALIRDQIRNLSELIQKPLGEETNFDELSDLKNVLKLKCLPKRIEAFDISNISGVLNTASMVSFYKGNPDKNNYRRYKIKRVSGLDDYRCLEEVLLRRFSYLKKEKLSLPDLIIIDGGKGQLNIAEVSLKKLNLKIPIISIAKREEKIYYNKKELVLEKTSLALHLVQRIRDEAHRFARKYHLLLRRKKSFEEINSLSDKSF
ncbi:MAG: excinuclease ABC subunit UvrC [Candidatus Omnitrophota bacterium]